MPLLRNGQYSLVKTNKLRYAQTSKLLSLKETKQLKRALSILSKSSKNKEMWVFMLCIKANKM